MYKPTIKEPNKIIITLLIIAPVIQSIIVEVAATFACLGFFSPIRFPTLVDDAKPIANGTMKNKLAILIATE